MSRRVLPKLRHLIVPQASSPHPNGAGTVAGVRPLRGLSTWLPGGCAACSICGGYSAGRQMCVACGSFATKPPLVQSPYTLSSITAAGGPSPQILTRKVLLLNENEGFPLQLEDKDPLVYFQQFPLLISVDDPNGGLNIMLVLNPDKPWVLSEGGKFSVWTLKQLVTEAHGQGYTLGKEQLALENLCLSSDGRFKFKNPVTRYSFNTANRIEDFAALGGTMSTLVKLLYGENIVSFLPDDFTMLVTDLSQVSDPDVADLWLECPPPLLSATVYGLAWMKLHGLFMDDGKGSKYNGSGLLATHTNDADVILQSLSYSKRGVKTDDWTMIANDDPWLTYWFNYMQGRYSVNVGRHKLIFPRNVISHSLSQRVKFHPNSLQLKHQSCLEGLAPKMLPLYLTTLRRQCISCCNTSIPNGCLN